MSDSKSSKKLQSEILSYANNFLLTLYWFIKKGRNSKTFIGIDALNAVAGVLLKFIGFKFKLIYYSVDYSPSRFENKLLNLVYTGLDSFAAKNSDCVWNSSERIRSVRSLHGLPDAKNLLVENGIYPQKNLHEGEIPRNKDTIVVIEHLIKEKGVQLVVEALKDIRKINPNATLVIIGTGPYEEELKRIAVAHGVLDYITFITETDPVSYIELLPSYGIGLCLHNGVSNSFIYYSDPISSKELLQAGLPLVVTDTLAISADVEKMPLGEVISYNSGSLIVSLKHLWDDAQFYSECKSNALKYVENKSWNKIYDDAFSKLVQ